VSKKASDSSWLPEGPDRVPGSTRRSAPLTLAHTAGRKPRAARARVHRRRRAPLRGSSVVGCNRTHRGAACVFSSSGNTRALANSRSELLKRTFSGTLTMIYQVLQDWTTPARLARSRRKQGTTWCPGGGWINPLTGIPEHPRSARKSVLLRDEDTPAAQERRSEPVTRVRSLTSLDTTYTRKHITKKKASPTQKHITKAIVVPDTTRDTSRIFLEALGRTLVPQKLVLVRDLCSSVVMCFRAECHSRPANGGSRSSRKVVLTHPCPSATKRSPPRRNAGSSAQMDANDPPPS